MVRRLRHSEYGRRSLFFEIFLLDRRFWLLCLSVNFFLIVWALRKRCLPFRFAALVVIVPLLIASIFDASLSVALGQIKGFGRVTPESTVVMLPYLDKMGTVNFYLEEHWFALNFGCGKKYFRRSCILDWRVKSPRLNWGSFN